AAINAYNYSLSEKGTNEDARVELERLQAGQTVVGLTGRRGLLRRSYSRGLLESQAEKDAGSNFTSETVQQVEQQLSAADNRSMQAIAQRIFNQQEAAQKLSWPLNIDIALRGRVIAFERKLQVKPDVEMSVSFAGSKPFLQSNMIDYGWALGIAAVVFIGCACARRGPRPEPPPMPSPPPVSPLPPSPPDGPESSDEVIEDVPVD
ncbi:MAG: hypothetical protein HQ559_08335, partial [Lentisphaerae bacterium]|nr:hypothetical protein [Lentisphaerota bacterium]